MGDTTVKYHFPYPFGTDPPNGATQIRLLAEQIEAVLKGQFVEHAVDGSVKVTTGGVTRPLPFATWCANVTCNLVNQALLVRTVTLPSGRFTAAPIVQGVTSWHFFNLSVSLSTTTSVTFEVAHINSTPATATMSAYLTGIQMTPGSGPGLLMASERAGEVVSVEVTCTTVGCENEGISITVQTVADATIGCGVCGADLA